MAYTELGVRHSSNSLHSKSLHTTFEKRHRLAYHVNSACTAAMLSIYTNGRELNV